MERTRNQHSVPLLLIVVAFLLVTTRVAGHFLTPAAPKGNLVQWVPLEDVSADSSNRIVLLDFTAEWCMPCHMLDEQVFGNPALAEEINARFIPVRVTDRQREDGRNSRSVESLQQRYGVRSFPTIIFAAPDGSERGRMEGYAGPEQFRRVMESIR